MTEKQYIKNLEVPKDRVDVILDTDAYNEIDDQFAIAYMLKNPERINVVGITVAPFLNHRATSIPQGVENSYKEIIKLLSLAGKQELQDFVFKGSTEYLADEKTPIENEAVDFIISKALNYSPESPLYIVAIGAITNVASALIKEPGISENIVIVWLGGHAHHMPDTAEFNMMQDVAAARVVFTGSAPLVQLACKGVVDKFATSKYELEHWLLGKNALCDFLTQNTIDEAESYAKCKPWTRVIWDVTAVAWLLNDDSRFMQDTVITAPIPTYDNKYETAPEVKPMRYVYSINRDALFEDLFNKLGEQNEGI